MKKYKDVDAYIRDFPRETQNHLKKLRTHIKKFAPNALEKISYGIPAYMLNGRLVYFGAFREHISLFPGSGKIRDEFGKALVRYRGGKGTIQFPSDKPLPLGLIAKIVKFRVKENLAKKTRTY